MSFSHKSMNDNIRKYCSKIGKNPLITQGAGGNVSWKENDTLWVKASGTCLENADKEDIFIPVNLTHLKSEIKNKNFSVAPEVIGSIKLKPSIETLLHALMPHRVVLHLHAVEILAHLIRQNFIDDFNNCLGNNFSFAVVEYFKPGENLASAIDSVLETQPLVNIIFLKNHGVVIGAETITDVDILLSQLIKLLITKPIFNTPKSIDIPEVPQDFKDQYSPVLDLEVQQLVLNPALSKRLKNEWALYPDHVVFLGPRPHVYQTWSELKEKIMYSNLLPELVFLIGEGVFVNTAFTKVKHAQLRCYFDVLIRQNPDTSLNVLDDDQISELLNWDAERYRLSLTDELITS